MKLTKFAHSCFVLEEQGQKVIVDPGLFGEMPSDTSNTTVLIITHEHPDHFSPENISKIIETNPGLRIYGAEEVGAQLEGVIVPEKNKIYDAGPFQLEFYGDLHEFIRPGVAVPHNLGIRINDKIAYPGDSFDQTRAVKLLLVPASAPWLRSREAVDFIANASAEIIIPTHDALLSEIGQQTYDRHYQTASEGSGKTYRRLNTGESIDI